MKQEEKFFFILNYNILKTESAETPNQVKLHFRLQTVSKVLSAQSNL